MSELPQICDMERPELSKLRGGRDNQGFSLNNFELFPNRKKVLLSFFVF